MQYAEIYQPYNEVTDHLYQQRLVIASKFIMKRLSGITADKLKQKMQAPVLQSKSNPTAVRKSLVFSYDAALEEKRERRHQRRER